MNLPQIIRIAGVDYTVVTSHEHNDPRLDGNACIIDHNRCQIAFSEAALENAKPRLLEYMLHELIHGVEVAYETRLEEEAVCRLARGLAAVLVDNPYLVDWIYSKVFQINKSEERTNDAAA